MTELNRAIHAALAPAIQQWFRQQTVNINTSYYLYARPALPGERLAPPIIAADAPGDEWSLAMPEKLSIGWTRELAQQRCYDALQRCPILGEGEQ